jgi:hypothetical protein
LFLAAAVWAAAFPTGAAAADLTVGPLYVTGRSGEYGTMSIDLTTGVTTFSSIGTTTPIIAGMGFGSDGNLYALDFQSSGAHLWQFNNYTSSAATTDKGAVLGPMGAPLTTVGAATNSSGQMFALDQNNPSVLYQLNPVTGVSSTSVVGTSNLPDPPGLAALDKSGNLYAVNLETGSGPSNLYKFTNPGSSPTATLVGQMFSGDQLVTAGTFATDSNGGLHLIGFESDPTGNSGNSVYDINFTTGAVTLIGTYSFGMGNTDNVFAAVAAQTVPEPSTLVLFSGIGVLGLGLRTWRNRSAVA